MPTHRDVPASGPSTPPHGRPGAAMQVAGHTVLASRGKVWLHPASPQADGDLSPAAARSLAAALLVASEQATRQLRRQAVVA